MFQLVHGFKMREMPISFHISNIQSDIHRTHASQNCARMGFIDPSIDPREQRDGDVRGRRVVLQFNRFGRTNDNVFQYYTVYSRTNY